MTLPTLINNYKKQVAVNKLKKFYSVMTQAIKLEEAKNGPIEYWMTTCPDKNNCFEPWYNEHLDKHIKSVFKRKANGNSSSNYEVEFADGSGFNAYAISGSVNIFYCTEFKYCGSEKYDGTRTFLFSICKLNGKYKFVTSNCNAQTQTREKLLDSCLKGNFDNEEVFSQGRRHYCTRLIEYDGWEMKDDYPWFQAKQPEKE